MIGPRRIVSYGVRRDLNVGFLCPRVLLAAMATSRYPIPFFQLMHYNANTCVNGKSLLFCLKMKSPYMYSQLTYINEV